MESNYIGREFSHALDPLKTFSCMYMQKVSYIPWLRIGAESVAIVAIIVLAFGIDAWYDGAIEQSRADNYERRIEI